MGKSEQVGIRNISTIIACRRSYKRRRVRMQRLSVIKISRVEQLRPAVSTSTSTQRIALGRPAGPRYELQSQAYWYIGLIRAYLYRPTSYACNNRPIRTVEGCSRIVRICDHRRQLTYESPFGYANVTFECLYRRTSQRLQCLQRLPIGSEYRSRLTPILVYLAVAESFIDYTNNASGSYMRAF